MGLLTDQQWSDLHAGCRRSAVHLELRDVYSVLDEADMFEQWKSGQLTESQVHEWWAPWLEMTRGMSDRGVRMRRARVVSEPLSEYIHYEWSIARNQDGGEQIRWLPRQCATGLAVVPVDFWLFDDETVVFNHFSGTGEWIDNEITRDPDIAARCRESFEAVWSAAVPHDSYRPVLQ